MVNPVIYQIRIQGHLSDYWEEWFGSLRLENKPDGEAVLTGALDQAGLYGVMNQIQAFGLTLLSINIIQTKMADQE